MCRPLFLSLFGSYIAIACAEKHNKFQINSVKDGFCLCAPYLFTFTFVLPSRIVDDADHKQLDLPENMVLRSLLELCSCTSVFVHPFLFCPWILKIVNEILVLFLFFILVVGKVLGVV